MNHRGSSATRSPQGFSLIELIIVVSIVLIITAVAIPNLLRSRASANEAAALGAVSTINTAEVAYASNFPECGFAEKLAYLGGDPSLPAQTAAGLIDATLAQGTKGGYRFTADGGTGGCGGGNSSRENYTVTAQPLSPQTGERYFFSDQSGVIRYSEKSPANVDSPPLQ